MERIPVMPVNKYPKPDMESLETRDKDDDTEALIQAALKSEEALKAAKKGKTVEAPKVKKAKTAPELHKGEEEGPVKEALVGIAQTKRASKRKANAAGAVDDTDMPEDVEAFEEDVEAEAAEEADDEEAAGDKGAVPLEPFNLKSERERGHFDDDGNYVEDKGDPTEEKDAWLDSSEAKVVSAKVRAAIKAQQAAMEAAERQRRQPLTEKQIAAKKAEMASVMQPGENVTRALKRLGGNAANGGGRTKALGKRERARLKEQASSASAAASADADVAGSSSTISGASEAFQLLTGLADELLAEGEMDVYSDTREQLERSARMWLPAASVPSTAIQNGGSVQQRQSVGVPGIGAAPAVETLKHLAAAAGDSDDDMFGDSDKEEQDEGAKHAQHAVGAGPGPGSATTAAGTDAGAMETDLPGKSVAASSEGAAQRGAGYASTSTGAHSTSKAAAADTVDYSSWPIKELRRFLEERKVPTTGLVEKSDLVAKVEEAVAAMSTGTTTDPFSAPPGYVFDPASGYFHSMEAGMYYDPNSGGYCQASTGQWYTLDAAGQFQAYAG